MAADTDTARLELRLKGMLARIFSDGVVTDEERAELTAAIGGGGLPEERVQAVMADFLAKSAMHFTADGKVTESERAKLEVIVRELKLPDACIPESVKRALTP